MERVIGLILHHGRPAALRRCLSALAASERVPERVLVLDNGSGDGAAAIGDLSGNGLDIELLTSRRNLGFAGGVNRGLEAIASRPWTHALLLNDDAMVAHDCLPRLLDAAAGNHRAGLLGAEIRSARAPRRLESTGLHCSPRTGRVRSLDAGCRAAARPGPPRTRSALSGCALLVPRAVIEQVGGPDADFFLYFEDLEWSHRVRAAGFELLFVPGAKVFHEGGRLSGPDRVYYSTRNQLRLVDLVHPLPGRAGAARAGIVAALNLAALVRTARGRPLAGLRAWRSGLCYGLIGRVGPRPLDGADG